MAASEAEVAAVNGRLPQRHVTVDDRRTPSAQLRPGLAKERKNVDNLHTFAVPDVVAASAVLGLRLGRLKTQPD